MKIEKYLHCIEKLEIPSSPPDGLSRRSFNYDFDNFMSYARARDFCIKRGLWVVIDQIWTSVLADWIGNRKVLEIMAGGGWVAKALSDHGISLIAIDNFSWLNCHTNMNLVYPVQNMPAQAAVQEINADVLLVSWPPYEEDEIVSVCNIWGSDRPIIYIGEGLGGCTGTDEFHENFREVKGMPEIPLMSWNGIHDYCSVGRWTGRR